MDKQEESLRRLARREAGTADILFGLVLVGACGVLGAGLAGVMVRIFLYTAGF